MKLAWVGLFLALFVAPGCATMNPYVQHNRHVAPAAKQACMATKRADPALDYSCEMAIRMESARAQIVTTRSGLTASIFPIAGIIGYNTARGFNAPTNIALTAGGFAGYSAITTLAQPDRIRVYDNGLRSTYCAIGIYRNEVSKADPESAERFAIRREAARIRGLINALIIRTKEDHERAELPSLLSIVDGIDAWLDASSPNRTLASQLTGFIGNTITKVNSQLTLTVPDNRQVVGDALSTLHSSPVPKTDKAALLAGLTTAPLAYSRGLTEIQIIRLAVSRLGDMYGQLGASGAANTAQLNFADCAYADITDLGIKDTVSRFMLGPGDAYAGKQFTVVRGSDFEATISGGVLPYTATSSAKQNGTDVVTPIVNGGQLKVSIPVKSGVVGDSIYVILVNDATNRYSKSLELLVPAN